MKILLIMSSINYSGAPKVLVWLANRFAKECFDVSIMTIYDEPKGQNINQEVKLFCLNITQSQNWIIRNTIQMVQIAKEYMRFFKTNNFDIVISFGDTPGILILILKKLFNIKVIISERGDPYTKESKMDNIRKSFYNLADVVVFQTKGAKEYFNKKIKKKSIVIPNAVIKDKIPEKYKGVRENIIVSVGRLDIFQKRQDLLIEAFSLISHEYPEMKLVFYGDGPDKEKLVELAEKKDLKSKVEFPGVTNNVYESIKKAKVFVLSSDYEGIPNALIEAMSVGMPVISTDCSPGGARLLIKNYKNGILVRKRNIKELAQEIKYILDNPDHAEEMGDNALYILEEYNEEKIFKMWENFIKEVVDGV